MNARQQIAAIDRQIDEVHLALIGRAGRFNTLNAAAWQKAWDANPDLRELDRELYRQRGAAQDIRDTADAAAAMKAARSARLRRSKCPTCGGTQYAV